MFDGFILGLLGVTSLNEDSFYLNVWNPAKMVDQTLPIKVWTYGGAFQFSTTSIDRGECPAKKGIVVVSANYPFGAFGFFTHPELSRVGGGGSGSRETRHASPRMNRERLEL